MYDEVFLSNLDRSFIKDVNVFVSNYDEIRSIMNAYVFHCLKNQKAVYSFDRSWECPDYKKLIEFIEGLNFNLIISDDNSDDGCDFLYLREDAIVKLEVGFNQEDGEIDDAFLLVHTTKKELRDELKHFYEKFNTRKRDTKGAIHALTQTNEGLQFTYIGNSGKPIELSNYTQSISEKYEYICNQLKLSDPDGRLFLFHGKPGTGKSYYIRGLLSELSSKCDFVIIHPDIVDTISGPNILPALMDFKDKRPVIFILEDADSCLTPRGSDNMGLISSLLNLTDGFLGHTLDIKIIATTNANIKEFDKALIRKGRLSCEIHFDVLSEEKAYEIFLRLTEGKEHHLKTPEEMNASNFMENFSNLTLADVYALARNLEPENEEAEVKKSKKKMGF